MSDSDPPESAEEMAERMACFAKRGRRTMQAFMERQAVDGGFQITDPMMVGKVFMELGAKMMADPQKLTEAQVQLWQGYADIFAGAAKRLSGEAVNPIVEPATGDRRFKDAAWSEQALFDAIKQTYLLTFNWLQ
ncbi:MAG: class I poly(R)-hydroxyalkanoic acid synthase, partial [Alphaproteobacteria bacterium]|nr:class I poly(R)-hydroxyalkanoic acid synthase [Alphaproteobacteria bacterium]